jgi:hypothetical protein
MFNGLLGDALWEGEAPAELTTPWFGRSLTLPSVQSIAWEKNFAGINPDAC